MLTVQDILDGTTLWLGLGLRKNSHVEEVTGEGYARVPYSLQKDNLVINPKGVFNAKSFEFNESSPDWRQCDTLIIFQREDSDYGVCKEVTKRMFDCPTIIGFHSEGLSIDLNYILDFHSVSERIYQRGTNATKCNKNKFNIGDYVICDSGYKKIAGTITEIKFTKGEIYYNVFENWVKETDVTLYFNSKIQKAGIRNWGDLFEKTKV